MSEFATGFALVFALGNTPGYAMLSQDAAQFATSSPPEPVLAWTVVTIEWETGKKTELN